MTIETLGIDIAKNVFQLHGCSTSAPLRQNGRVEEGRISSLFGRLRSSNFQVFAEKISLADPRFSPGSALGPPCMGSGERGGSIWFTF